MQLDVPAPLPLRGRVGDIFPAVRPVYLIALLLHQIDEMGAAFGDAHGIIDGDCQPHFPALSLVCGAVFRRRHSGCSLLLWLDHRQSILPAQVVRGLTDSLDVVLVRVVFSSGFRADGVDNQVGMEVVPVGMGADQHLMSRKFLGQLQPNLVGSCRRYLLIRAEGLNYMIVHSTIRFTVEPLGIHELLEGRICHAVHSGHQMSPGFFVPSLLLPLAILHGAMHPTAGLTPCSNEFHIGHRLSLPHQNVGQKLADLGVLIPHFGQINRVNSAHVRQGGQLI